MSGQQSVHQQDLAKVLEKDVLYPLVVPGAAFTLQLRLKDATHLADVARCLKAFLMFGAVGGRSRKGYGCIDSGELPVEVRSASLGGGLPWFAALSAPPAGLVSLRGARLFIGPSTDSVFEAWRIAVEIFHHFRKAELPGRRRPSLGPGSHTTWPEADMIRQLKQPPIQPHNASFKNVQPPAFPRAQLGLPLKFQSQNNHAGAFGECDLHLLTNGTEKMERLASPVIVKPIKLDGQWHQAILILRSSDIPVDALRLANSQAARPSANCTGAPAGLFDGSTNVPFPHGHSNVLDVFAEYLGTYAKWTRREVSTL